MMKDSLPAAPGALASAARLDVTRVADGRYAVAFTRAGATRRSYAASLAQVISQAQRTGAAVVTDEPALRARCRELGLPLADAGPATAPSGEQGG